MNLSTATPLGRLGRRMTIAAVMAGAMTLAAADGGREASGAAETRQAPEVSAEIDWYAIERDWYWMNRFGSDEWDRLFPAGPAPQDPIVPCWDPRASRPDFPSELCFTSTLPGPPVDFPVVTQNRTLGRFDFTDIGINGACAGGGPQFSGTGLGSDLSYKISVDIECDLEVTVRMLTTVAEECEPDPENPSPPDPLEPWDVALYVIYEPVRSPKDDPVIPCSEPAMNCVSISDGGGIGQAESITFTALTTEVYYIVVDGYLGSAGYFEIEIVEDGSTGCRVDRPVPVPDP